MNSVDTVTVLNRLIITSKNGEHALRAAAEEAWHAELKQALTSYSHFFAEAALELQEAVRKAGGNARGLGTFDNTVHRAWMHIHAKMYGRNENTILDDVERDEAEADLMYAEALHDWDVSPEVHALIERQAESARRHHAEIRELRARLVH